MTKALVLGGGGAKGAFQVGAVWYLQATLGYLPTEFSGTSVGAINAAKIAEGFAPPGPRTQPGDPGIVGLWAIWRSLRSRSDMVSQSAELDAFTDTDVEQHFLGTGERAALATAGSWTWVPIIGSVIGANVVAKVEKLIAGITAIGRTNGLENLGPISRLLGDPSRFDPRRIDAAGNTLNVSFVGADTGTLFRARKLRESGNGPSLSRALEARGRIVFDLPLADAIGASAAIPVLFRGPDVPEGLGREQRSFDGGVNEVLPIGAVEDARVVVAVSAGAPPLRNNYRSDHHPMSTYLTPTDVPAIDFSTLDLFADARRGLDLVTEEITQRDVERLDGHPVGHHLRPWFDVHDVDEVVPAKIAICTKFGSAAALDQVDPRLRNHVVRKYLLDLDTAIAWYRTALVTQQALSEFVHVRRALRELTFDHSPSFASASGMSIPRVRSVHERVLLAGPVTYEDTSSVRALAAGLVGHRRRFPMVTAMPGGDVANPEDALVDLGDFLPQDVLAEHARTWIFLGLDLSFVSQPSELNRADIPGVVSIAVMRLISRRAPLPKAVPAPLIDLSRPKWTEMMTWRKGSGPFAQLSAGSNTEDYGRPNALRIVESRADTWRAAADRRRDATQYLRPVPGMPHHFDPADPWRLPHIVPWANGEGVGVEDVIGDDPHVAFGQQLAMLTWNAGRLRLLRRSAFDELAPWSSIDLITGTKNIIGACLTDVRDADLSTIVCAVALGNGDVVDEVRVLVVRDDMVVRRESTPATGLAALITVSTSPTAMELQLFVATGATITRTRLCGFPQAADELVGKPLSERPRDQYEIDGVIPRSITGFQEAPPMAPIDGADSQPQGDVRLFVTGTRTYPATVGSPINLASTDSKLHHTRMSARIPQRTTTPAASWTPITLFPTTVVGFGDEPDVAEVQLLRSIIGGVAVVQHSSGQVYLVAHGSSLDGTPRRFTLTELPSLATGWLPLADEPLHRMIGANIRRTDGLPLSTELVLPYSPQAIGLIQPDDGTSLPLRLAEQFGTSGGDVTVRISTFDQRSWRADRTPVTIIRHQKPWE